MDSPGGHRGAGSRPAAGWGTVITVTGAADTRAAGVGPGSAGLAGMAAAARSRADADGDGSGMTRDATESIAVVGDPGRVLPGQIARFGELVGRDLMSRAFATLCKRGACDPRRHDDAWTCRPLTSGEQLEMLTLRAAITGDDRLAAAAGPAETGGSAPPGPQGPYRLRRPPPPAPRRADGRHRRLMR
jgi:hypothetical protein